MGKAKRIIHKCIQCGKERSILAYRVNKGSFTGLCLNCIGKRRSRSNGFGETHPQWNGGIQIDQGYVNIKAPANFPYPPMITTNGYIRRHRLIMSQHLGRELKRSEIIHHLNGNRQDDRIENLVLTDRNLHEHCTLIIALNNRITELEKKLARLLGEK